MKVLLLMLSASATAPTVLLAGVMLYLQTAFGVQFKPEVIIGGVLFVAGLSFMILWHQARRVFLLIDVVPELQRDVRGIRSDIGSLAEGVNKVKEIGDSILRREEAREWRLEQLERDNQRRNEEERKKAWGSGHG